MSVQLSRRDAIEDGALMRFIHKLPAMRARSFDHRSPVDGRALWMFRRPPQGTGLPLLQRRQL